MVSESDESCGPLSQKKKHINVLYAIAGDLGTLWRSPEIPG